MRSHRNSIGNSFFCGRHPRIPELSQKRGIMEEADVVFLGCFFCLEKWKEEGWHDKPWRRSWLEGPGNELKVREFQSHKRKHQSNEPKRISADPSWFIAFPQIHQLVSVMKGSKNCGLEIYR